MRLRQHEVVVARASLHTQLVEYRVTTAAHAPTAPMAKSKASDKVKQCLTAYNNARRALWQQQDPSARGEAPQLLSMDDVRGTGGLLQSTDVSTCALRFLHLEALEGRFSEELEYLRKDVANVLQYCLATQQRIADLLQLPCFTEQVNPPSPAWLEQALLDTKQEWAAIRGGLQLRLLTHRDMLSRVQKDMCEVFPAGVVDPSAAAGATGATDEMRRHLDNLCNSFMDSNIMPS